MQHAVDLLYVNVLDRPADPGGKASWVNALNSGAAMRADVVLGFSESQEHVLKLAPAIDDGIVIAYIGRTGRLDRAGRL